MAIERGHGAGFLGFAAACSVMFGSIILAYIGLRSEKRRSEMVIRMSRESDHL
jgi:hypothetical protein